ncbi:MAG: flagellin, partial [Candidatus Puniceispirillaceae bacterium]
IVSRLDLTELGGANEAVDVLDRAIAEILSRQAQLGAVQNRLESAVDNLTSQLLLEKLARGRIVDADFARETSRLIKSQLLGSSAQKVIANAQDTKQLLLSLIR